MNCVHGIRFDKPCPDCEWETNEERRTGVRPNAIPEHLREPRPTSPLSEYSQPKE